jgi:DNA modification methylase
MKGIKTHGFNVPVLIGLRDEIIAGHGRVLAAEKLGLETVPTICLAHLTAAQAQAFMLADNRLGEMSTWDDAKLAEHLRMFDRMDLGFSIEATGFDIAEIDVRLGAAADHDKPDPADQIPTQTGLQRVTRTGDLWVLGRHRVLCASALEPASYARLFEGAGRAAIVITDPPYNVKIEGHVSGLGRVKHRNFSMASGEMTSRRFTQFLTKVFELCADNSEEGSIHYSFMDWRHIPELQSAGLSVYTELKNVCVWVKHNAGMGSFYRSQHELIFVFKNGRAAHRNNIQLGKHGRHRSNVWSYRGINDFSRGTDEGNLLALHPTVKSVAMIADAILDCSTRGDIVLDPFLGSGTAVIASERTGRKCFGLELDPAYVDTIVRRWQSFTGDRAVLATSGRTFDQTQSEREAANA